PRTLLPPARAARASLPPLDVGQDDDSHFHGVMDTQGRDSSYRIGKTARRYAVARPSVWLSLLLRALGCKGGTENPAAANTFRIGVVTSLTGAAAPFGQPPNNAHPIA